MSQSHEGTNGNHEHEVMTMIGRTSDVIAKAAKQNDVEFQNPYVN